MRQGAVTNTLDHLPTANHSAKVAVVVLAVVVDIATRPSADAAVDMPRRKDQRSQLVRRPDYRSQFVRRLGYHSRLVRRLDYRSQPVRRLGCRSQPVRKLDCRSHLVHKLGFARRDLYRRDPVCTDLDTDPGRSRCWYCCRKHRESTQR